MLLLSTVLAGPPVYPHLVDEELPTGLDCLWLNPDGWVEPGALVLIFGLNGCGFPLAVTELDCASEACLDEQVPAGSWLHAYSSVTAADGAEVAIAWSHFAFPETRAWRRWRYSTDKPPEPEDTREAGDSDEPGPTEPEGCAASPGRAGPPLVLSGLLLLGWRRRSAPPTP